MQAIRTVSIPGAVVTLNAPTVASHVPGPNIAISRRSELRLAQSGPIQREERADDDPFRKFDSHNGNARSSGKSRRLRNLRRAPRALSRRTRLERQRLLSGRSAGR